MNAGPDQTPGQAPERVGFRNHLISDIDILNEYGIGCGACDVGTCLLKDIVSLHPLSKEQERALMSRIAAVL